VEDTVDTTFVPFTVDSLVGYDTTYRPYLEKELFVDRMELVQVLENHGVEVHSRTYKWPLSASQGELNEEVVEIDMPSTLNSKYKKVENVVWYYGVGVNQQQKLLADERRANLFDLGGEIAGYFAGTIGKVVFKGVGHLTSDQSDASVYVMLTDYENAVKFQYDQEFSIYRDDNIVSSSTIRMETPRNGRIYLGLENDDLDDALTAYINVAVWQRIREYRDVEKQKEIVKPRYLTLHKQRMVVKTRKIRIVAK